MLTARHLSCNNIYYHQWSINGLQTDLAVVRLNSLQTVDMKKLMFAGWKRRAGINPDPSQSAIVSITETMS